MKISKVLLTLLVVLLSAFSGYPAKHFASLNLDQRSLLEKSLSIKWDQNGLFKGRMATIMETNTGKSEFLYLDNFNEDFRAISFWKRNIPVLDQYSQLTSPRLLLTYLFFLNAPEDLQTRNRVFHRSSNVQALSTLGVTFLAISKKLTPPGEGVIKVGQYGSLNRDLYKIEESNTKGYSVTKYKFLQDIGKNSLRSELIQSLTQRDFILLEKPLFNRKFTHIASNSSIRGSKNGIKVQASSSGWSIIVVPFEYSNCLELLDITPGSFKPKIYPANLGLTAITFYKNLNVELRYRYLGSFKFTCRIEDFKDIQRLKPFLP
jgi:hypothetical protein